MTVETSGEARNHRWVVPCVMLAMLFGPLNSTMVTVALPDITRDLSLSRAAAGWIVTGYLIAMAALHPVAGKLGDRWDRRRLMAGALLVALAASVGAGLSSSLAILVPCRLLQAAAGAAMAPNGIAVLRAVVPASRLGSVLGVAGATAPLAAAVGPVLGTALANAFGWRSVFLANLLIIALPLVLVWSLPHRPAPPTGRPPFDAVGAIASCVTLVALAMLLNVPSSQTALVVWAVVLSVALPLLLVREFRCPDPVLQFRLFARRRFLAAAAGVCLSNFAMYGVLLTVPVLFLLRPGWPITLSGIALALMTGLSAALTPVGGRLADHHGPALPATAGMLLVTAGLVPVAVAVRSMTVVMLMVALALVGAGLGLATAAYRTDSVRAVSPADTGMASGMYFTCRYLGSIVCSSLLGGPLAAHDEPGIAVDYLVFAAAGLLCALLTAALSRQRRSCGCRART